MKRVTVYLCLLLSVVHANGQSNTEGPKTNDKPDLTGTWVLDRSKSPSRDLFQKDYSVKLVIKHSEPEVRISRTTTFNNKVRSQESVYYTDGRGETNSSWVRIVNFSGGDPSGKVKSKTTWDGVKLVSRASVSAMVLGDPFYIDVSERRELSSDGKTLTITISTTQRAGRPVIHVFNREERLPPL